jgi:hypothetical protein
LECDLVFAYAIAIIISVVDAFKVSSWWNYPISSIDHAIWGDHSWFNSISCASNWLPIPILHVIPFWFCNQNFKCGSIVWLMLFYHLIVVQFCHLLHVYARDFIRFMTIRG